MEDLKNIKCPYIDKSIIWKKADNFRNEYWSSNLIPINIEKIIEQQLNLYIIPEFGLATEFDMEAYLTADLTSIVVDKKRYLDDRYLNRLRFSFAHEIGHLVLHKDIYPKFGITNTQRWLTFMNEIPEKQYFWFEYQADEFAGRLLVPLELLNDELSKCLKKLPLDLHDLLERDSDIVLASLSPALCKPFGVSEQVISIRVKKEGLWPPKLD